MNLFYSISEFQNKHRLSRSKPKERIKNDIAFDMSCDDPNTVDITNSMNHLIIDDILIKIKHKGTFGSKLICRFGINTSMIEDE